MKAVDLIAELEKLDPETEVYTDQECAMPVNGVYTGYYIDDGFDAPHVVCIDEEDKSDYNIPPSQGKVAVIE